MIANDAQYQFTKERLDGFKGALVMLNAPENELKKKDPLMWQLNIEGLQSFIEDFTAQMEEYEALINRNEKEPIEFEISSIEELPRALIKARIAAKISQKELSLKLGISEQQLQRAENWEYQETPLTQLLEVGRVLGVKMQQKTILAVA